MAYIGTKPANQITDSTLIADGTVTPADLSTGRPVWNTSGDVGIGTSAPDTKLSVLGNSVRFTQSTYSSGTTGSGILIDYASTYSRISSYINGFANWGNLILQEAGRVGINTTNPATSLDVNGTIRVSGNSQLQIFNSGGTSGVSIQTDNASSTAMTFATGGAERMRIGSNGYVSVNTTGTTVGGANNHLSIVATNIWNVAYAIGLRNLGTTAGGFFVNFANSSDTSIGSISQNTTTSVAYNTTSDYRLKENVAPMTGALAKVAQLKPCTFTWKSTGEASQGFIAHELQAVVPDCVTGEKDAVDDNGNPRYQGVDTSFLVATLTAAIQELKAELDATKAEVALLKSQGTE